MSSGQLIYDMRTRAGISQAELARRMNTSQCAVSRLEEGGGARNRLDTLARASPERWAVTLCCRSPMKSRRTSTTQSRLPDSVHSDWQRRFVVADAHVRLAHLLSHMIRAISSARTSLRNAARAELVVLGEHESFGEGVEHLADLEAA